MTSTAAAIAGIDDRVGALEAGRDADVVLWTGDPLDVASTVRRVLIDGHTVYTAPVGAAASAAAEDRGSR
jgi:imidazolonepropionase-like amidohydrolase